MTYFSGSAITRQERSIRGDIQTLDCDAIKKDLSKYDEMYWKVKGDYGEIAYCNSKRKCWTTKSQLLEDKRIQVIGISSSNLTIKRTLPQKTTGHTLIFTCEVHKTDNSIDISEVTIVYSLECKTIRRIFNNNNIIVILIMTILIMTMIIILVITIMTDKMVSQDCHRGKRNLIMA